MNILLVDVFGKSTVMIRDRLGENGYNIVHVSTTKDADDLIDGEYGNHVDVIICEGNVDPTNLTSDGYFWARRMSIKAKLLPKKFLVIIFSCTKHISGIDDGLIYVDKIKGLELLIEILKKIEAEVC